MRAGLVEVQGGVCSGAQGQAEESGKLQAQPAVLSLHTCPLPGLEDD